MKFLVKSNLTFSLAFYSKFNLISNPLSTLILKFQFEIHCLILISVWNHCLSNVKVKVKFKLTFMRRRPRDLTSKYHTDNVINVQPLNIHLFSLFMQNKIMYGFFVEKIRFQQTMRIILCLLLDNPFSGMLDDDDCRDTTNQRWWKARWLA